EARASGDGATIWLTYRGGDFGALSFPEPESNGLLLGEFGEDGVPQWALVGDSPEIEFSTEVVSGPSFRCFLASTGRPLIFDGDTYNEDHEDFWGCTNADGVLAWADTLDSNIVTLVANDDAIFAIASNRDGSPVDLGEGPTNANAIARIDPATGSVEWQVGFLESVARPSSLSRYDATSDRMCFVISSFDAGDVRYEGETYVFDDGDALIACRDANTGAHLWARHITGERTQRVDVMAIAPDGGVFVAGDYSEELLVDDAAISCGEEFCFGEPYMLRLDPTGRLDWARELTSDEVFSQPGVDSMTSSSRAVYTMSRGVFDGPEGFIPMSTPLLSAHDPVTGDQLWSVLVESPGSILFQSFDIDVDDDHLVLYGRLSGDVTVAGEPALSVDGEGGILSFAVDD
ncbi:MAG: PQQ-binding-like beta-propeller repeat protein, partial [Myxococcota bacterium]